MRRPSFKREQKEILVLGGIVIAMGVAAVTLAAGVVLAYSALFFGALFFVYAARYYVASISVLLAPSVNAANGRNAQNGGANGNRTTGTPMISVHLALYNEERVVDRVLTACSNLDYPNYEVVVVDDSKDGTVLRLKEWILNGLKSDKQRIKIIHRTSRDGFKGGALNEALRHTDPRTEYVVVLDADFVPEPDILKKFLDYFNRHSQGGNGNQDGNGNGRYGNGRLAAVQGYQWHALNRSENWLTRGVSCEFSGSYMVDRTFQEVAGGLKMVSGSVYMIRADVLRQFGWTGSITEDWELTLRLYENGYKVLYTPLVQAPAECPSTLGKLIRQRMRWAEGHTFNVKKHLLPILTSPKVSLREKLEFLYFAPYYLQSLFLIIGTFAWLTSDVILGTRLPFWTAEVGWALVITNLLALPVMSLTGLFLEKRARRDFGGIISQLVLVYALSPYQAYASLKGLVEPSEGSWARTFKSGRLAGFPGRLEPRKVIRRVLPPRKRSSPTKSTLVLTAALGVSALLGAAILQGQSAGTRASDPGYYFSNHAAPSNYSPYGNTYPGESFLMHLAYPSGSDARTNVGSQQGSGPIFFSDPAPANLELPFGASVSIHLWVNYTVEDIGSSPDWGGGGRALNVRIDIYDPATNSISQIAGSSQTETIPLQGGFNFYQGTWGNIAEGVTILKGETLVATIWCTGCSSNPVLVYNSAAHASNIDFPIEVPENSISLASMAVLIPGVAGLVIDRRVSDDEGSEQKEGGLRRVQGWLIVSAALVFLTLPLALSLGDALASLANATGFDRLVSSIVPWETAGVGDLLRGFGLQAGNSANSVWLGGGFIPVSALVDWNCAGWQSFFLFGLTSVAGFGELHSNRSRLSTVLVGLGGVFAINVLRIAIVVLLGYYVSYSSALVFHDYGGTVMTLAWLLVFWTVVLNRKPKSTVSESWTSPAAQNLPMEVVLCQRQEPRLPSLRRANRPSGSSRACSA